MATFEPVEFDPFADGPEFEEEPSKIKDFIQRYPGRVYDIPGDIADIAKAGASATINAPNKILFGSGEDIRPRTVTPEPSGYETDEEMTQSAAERAARRTREQVKPPGGRQEGQLVNRVEGAFDLVGGPMQTVTSPMWGTIRAMGSRPLEEATGIPKEMSEMALGAVLGPRTSTRHKTAPTSDRLHDTSNSQYTSLRPGGAYSVIDFKREPFINIIRDVDGELFNAGYRGGSGGNKAVNLIQNMYAKYPMMRNSRQIIRWDDYHNLSSQLSAMSREVNDVGRRTPNAAAATMAKALLDEGFQNLRPSDVFNGRHLLGRAQQITRDASGNWGAYIRRSIIDDLRQKGETRTSGAGTGANYENVMRQNFGKLADNPKSQFRFSPEEIDYMHGINQGSATDNALRWMGKFSPASPISATLGQGLGRMLMGEPGKPLTAIQKIAIPLAGTIAKKYGEHRINNKLDELQEMASRRSPLHQNQPGGPMERHNRLRTRWMLPPLMGELEKANPEDYPPAFARAGRVARKVK